MPWRKVAAATLVALLLLAVTVVAVGAAVSVRVIGPSMAPTLRDGDRVLVRGTDRPQRLDLVVLRLREDGPLVVKRVVALPGDRVRIDAGPVVRVQPQGHGPWWRLVDRAWEGRWSRVVELPEQVVPPDGLFVLGDNPDHSEDSRTTGMAPGRLVSGTVRLRVHPPSAWGRPDQPATLQPEN